MTDAHFHRNGFDTFLVTNGHEVAFHGFHPWQTAACADIPAALLVRLVQALAALRGHPEAEIEAAVAANAARFVEALA